ncbi:MAG: ANTAR domain-containing protein [Bacillota bacterium]
MDGYRILLAVADQPDCNHLRDMLLRLGHNVIAATSEARSALRLAFEVHPDAMIIDPSIPDCGGSGALQILEEHRLMAVIFYSRNEEVIVEQAKKGWVMAYILPPIEEANIAAAVEVAVANFQRLSALEHENAKLQKNLVERRLVEQARGLLAEKKGLSEREAYHYMRHLSMNRRQPMARVAKEIIASLDKIRCRSTIKE